MKPHIEIVDGDLLSRHYDAPDRPKGSHRSAREFPCTVVSLCRMTMALTRPSAYDCWNYPPCGPVAQSAEQRTFNPKVVGSIPTGPTAFKPFVIGVLQTHRMRELWPICFNPTPTPHEISPFPRNERQGGL